jgi:hypothetical protein
MTWIKIQGSFVNPGQIKRVTPGPTQGELTVEFPDGTYTVVKEPDAKYVAKQLELPDAV